MCFSQGFPVSDFSDIFLSWRFSHTCAHPEKNHFATILSFSGFFGHFSSCYYQDLKCTKNQCAVIVGMHCSVGEWSQSCLHTTCLRLTLQDWFPHNIQNYFFLLFCCIFLAVSSPPCLNSGLVCNYSPDRAYSIIVVIVIVIVVVVVVIIILM